MSHMCIINIFFSIANTYLILFLSISTYIHNCIIAHMHFRESFADIKGDRFRFHPPTGSMNKANIGGAKGISRPPTWRLESSCPPPASAANDINKETGRARVLM